MSGFRQASSLEDELREQQRLAAAMRRRRRKRWLVPLLIVLFVFGGLFLTIYLTADRPENGQDNEATQSADATITIVAGGDVTLNHAMLRDAHTATGYDFDGFFTPLTRVVAGADLALVNVEGTFCGEPYSADASRYPESLLASLRECGFDVIQTANSYSIENGLTGLVSTKQAIEAMGMDALGTFASQEERRETGGVLVKEIKGIRLAIIGLTKGTNGLRLPEGAEYSVNLLFQDYDTNYTKIDRDGILALVDAAKQTEPDLILCMVHWGSEYLAEPSAVQKDIAKLLLDNGVNIILGSHSHRVGTLEWNAMPSLDRPQQPGVLAYSLGDLLSVSDREDTHRGCLLSITVTKEAGVTRIQDVSYVPTYSAAPSEELDVPHYAVYNMLDAISLYESSHYDRVSKQLYERMTHAAAELEKDIHANERTAAD